MDAAAEKGEKSGSVKLSTVTRLSLSAFQVSISIFRPPEDLRKRKQTLDIYILTLISLSYRTFYVEFDQSLP